MGQQQSTQQQSTSAAPEYEVEEERRPLLESSSKQRVAESARCNVLMYMFVFQFGSGMFGSLRAVYTDQVLHASDPVATATFALVGYFLCHAVSMPVLGKFSDAVGRKPLCLLGVSTMSAVFAVTASTVTPLVFVVAFCVLGVLDGSYTMTQLNLVDTSSAPLTGPLFRAFARYTKFDDADTASISERRVGALFSFAWVTGLVGMGIGVGFATIGSTYAGVRVSIYVVAGSLLLLDFRLAVSLPETVAFNDDVKKEDDGRGCCSLLGAAVSEQAAGFRLLFDTPRRRTLILASFFEHAAASGSFSLIMYWLVFKFGFGVGMQAAVSAIALFTVACAVVFLQGYAIEVADSSEHACAMLIAASLPFWALLGIATSPLIALLGVPAVISVAVFPEFRALLTADLDRDQQGFVQGALTSINAVADIAGSVALLLTFESTVDDDVPHDSHRSNHSYRANLIWHAVFAVQLLVIAILHTVPPPQDALVFEDDDLAAKKRREQRQQRSRSHSKKVSFYDVASSDDDDDRLQSI